MPVGIDSVVIVGNRVFQTAPLLGTIAIFPGDTIGFREVQAAEKRLWETGSFNDITVTASESPDGLVTLTFEVDEHPVVRARSIEGLESLDPGDVWDHIGLNQGLGYSPQLFVRGKGSLSEMASPNRESRLLRLRRSSSPYRTVPVMWSWSSE